MVTGERIYAHVSSKFLCHLHLATVSSYLTPYKNIYTIEIYGMGVAALLSGFFLGSCQPLCCLLSPLPIRIPISSFFNTLVSHHVVSRWISHSLFHTFGRLLNKNTITECVRANVWVWVCLLVYVNGVEKPPYIVLFHIPLSLSFSLSAYMSLSLHINFYAFV